MEYVEGVPIMDIDRLKKEQFNLQEVSKEISKAFCKMIY